MAHHFIRITAQDTGRKTVMEVTADDLSAIYTPADLARLLVGLPVHLNGVTHLDMMAFCSRIEDSARSHVISFEELRARMRARMQAKGSSRADPAASSPVSHPASPLHPARFPLIEEA